MQVILLEKIAKLGNLGDMVKVKPGYGRNYLIPQGKAIFATEANKVDFEKRRDELEQKIQQNLAQSQQRAEKLTDVTVEIASRALDEVKLYGSIGTREIAEAVIAQGFELHKKEIQLPHGPIRTLGEHVVKLQLHTDVSLDLAIKVVPIKD